MNAGLDVGFTPEANLLVGWIWLCLAFISGLFLGLGFHRENWLGGYGSLRRRLYRLAHISFFGLGAVNLAFYLTVKSLGISAPGLTLAGACFIVGAISMPVSCVLMAHFPRTRALFAIPVLSLLLAGTLTVASLLRSDAPRPNGPASPDTSTTSPEPFNHYAVLSLTSDFNPVDRAVPKSETVSTVSPHRREAVETAPVHTIPRSTGLKPGVNETPVYLRVNGAVSIVSTLQRANDFDGVNRFTPFNASRFQRYNASTSP